MPESEMRGFSVTKNRVENRASDEEKSKVELLSREPSCEPATLAVTSVGLQTLHSGAARASAISGAFSQSKCWRAWAGAGFVELARTVAPLAVDGAALAAVPAHAAW
jgi:hypothetical protein